MSVGSPVHDARDGPDAQAALWHAKLTLGTGDPQAFERWRGQSTANALAFARVQAAWEALPGGPARAWVVRPTRRRFLRAGTGVVLGSASAFLLVERAAAWPQAETTIGERRLLRLNATDRALLDTNSALAWHPADSGLRLKLKRGRTALHLHGRTNWLEAGGSRTQLSRGVFDVRLREAGTEIIPLGVGVAGAAGAVAASGGHMLRVQADGSASASPVASLDVATAWQTGEILFRDQPLAAAVADYNRYLRRPIVIDDPAIASLRIGGRFTTTDPASFLDALRLSLNIAARPQNDRILLVRA